MQINDLKKSKVLVIGDLMLDQYINGIVDRVSPEAPVPIIKPSKEEVRLGGAANVAANIASLGGKVSLLGIIGKDEFGLKFRQTLKKYSIKAKLVTSSNPTITKQRIVVSQQQLLRLDRESFFSKKDCAGLKNISASEMKKHDLVILSDYGKGSLQDIKSIIKLAKKEKCRVIVDPKGKDFMKYKGASVMTPNYIEFCEAVGTPDNEPDLTKKAFSLVKSLGLEVLLITRGADGITLIRSEKKKLIRNDFSAESKEVFDVSGAGDTVIATLAAALSVDNDILEATKLANIAAGIVVEKFGTSTIKFQEIQSALSVGKDSKLLTNSEAILKIKKAQEKNEKVVFTNGCFDILHLGHITYLQKAKELGSKLIVAVNSDSSVKSLKGSKRPINNLSDRMLVLASLECVDWIISFTDSSPEKIIRKLKPNVLVKGDDYKTDEIAGNKFVLSNGGQVKTIPLVKGISTSSTISKILKLESIK